jgi:putative tricarboxylic transport membrane protein
MIIRAPKDFWSGIMFVAFAAVAIFVARGYSMGAAGRMGAGYFPMALGIVLAGLGVVLTARAFFVPGERIDGLALRPLLTIVLAVCLFGILIQHLGLVFSLIVVIAVSALASRDSKPLEVAALAAVLAAFSVAIFVYALRLPLSTWPNF